MTDLDHLRTERVRLVRAGSSSVSRRSFLATTASATAAAVASGWPCLTTAAKPKTGWTDAHVHVWTEPSSTYPLKEGFAAEQMRLQRFTPNDFFNVARHCDVVRAVLVQMSYYGTDNSYMLDAIAKHPASFRGIAVIAPDDRPADTMKRLARRGVRGFRIRQTTAGDWLGGPDMATMWNVAAEEGLAICPLMNPDGLPRLSAMCKRYPETRVAIDHFARIGCDGQFRPVDIEALCRLADYANVHVKASAFYALGRKEPPYLDVEPLVRRVVNCFGPERVMWASDSPFQVLGEHTYRAAIGLVHKLDFLDDSARRWLLHKTADKLFFEA